MYEIKKIVSYLDKKIKELVKGETLFAGKIDEEFIIENNNFAVLIVNDNVVSSQPSSFGTYNTSYGRDSIRIVVIGNDSIYETQDFANKIYSLFRENKSIQDIGIIQSNPIMPVMMGKIKGYFYKYNIFVDIIYETK